MTLLSNIINVFTTKNKIKVRKIIIFLDFRENPQLWRAVKTFSTNYILCALYFLTFPDFIYAFLSILENIIGILYISTSILRSCRIIDKTTKFQVQCFDPPTNFFDNLSIELKMSRIRELYQIFHIKKIVDFDKFSRKNNISKIFFVDFSENSKTCLRNFSGF